VGGESGPGARPCDPAWIRSILARCRAAGVATFVKQLGDRPVGLRLARGKGGDPAEWPEDLKVREFPRPE
jgi:protein gp37